MDLDPDMAASTNYWGSSTRGLGLLLSCLGLIRGRFRAAPHKNHMAVPIHWGSFWWLSFPTRGPSIWGP